MTFEELGVIAPIRQAVAELGFAEPMPVQERVIPLLLGTPQDIIALAQTGTGKTAAFGIPLLQNLRREARPAHAQPQALILAPTRELCIQITKDIIQYATHLPNVQILAVYGGASIEEQMRELRRGVQLVVATPGRLLDLMRREAIELKGVQNVVLDEADEMLNMGFREELQKILQAIPRERNLLLFSATMSAEMRQIVEQYLRKPVKIQVGESNVTNRNIQHQYYVVASQDRYLALKRIVDLYPKIYGIIFCKTRRSTQEIAEQLIADGYNADALHGDLSQAQRDQVMQRFRLRSLQLLVATDVAARGLDVEELTHVIHFGLPPEWESYTHRSGRTARAGRSGTSIALCHAREMGLIRLFEEKGQITFKRMMLPTSEEICQSQLNQFILRLEHTIPDEEAIAPFIQSIEKRLSWLSRTELLQRLVSLELQRLLEYYQKEGKINEVAPATLKRSERQQARQKGSQRKREGMKERKSVESHSKWQMLRINIGKRDRLYPNTLIALLRDAMLRQVEVGKIEIRDRYTTFEVLRSEVSAIQSALQSHTYHEKPIVTIAIA